MAHHRIDAHVHLGYWRHPSFQGLETSAILASLVTGSPAAVTIALCHLLFNIWGTMIFLPLKKLPIRIAQMLGKATAKRRWMALLYVILVFFVIPGILILL